MEDTAIPYELPEAENHSFFFIDQRVEPSLEAKLHRHDAWELYYVVHGQGNRMAGDTLQPFAAGDVVLIPPSMLHRWEYAADSVDEDGCVRYLMVAFSHSLVERCMEVFPELRNRLAGVMFPTEVRTGECTDNPQGIIRNKRYGRTGTFKCNVPSTTCHFHFVRPYICRETYAYREGRSAYAADLRIRNEALRSFHCVGRYCGGGGHEPFGVLLLFQAVQGDDLFAVRHAIPSEYRLRVVEALAKRSVGDMLSCRIQRPAAFYKNFH